MKKIQQGFTLIELMIVVAIIGILAAVAIPAYTDYITKAKLAKVASSVDVVKSYLALYLQENGGFPNDTNTVAYPGNVAYAAGTINVWTSLGLKAEPTLPMEVSSMVYTAAAPVAPAVQSPTFTLVLTFNKIKATSPGVIDGTTLTIVPVTGSTNVEWDYTCAASTDIVLKKFFRSHDGNQCAL